MTVGAVIVPAGAAQALADAAGRVAVRRIVDAAWAGGALPIVVVLAAGGDEPVRTALAGSPAVVVTGVLGVATAPEAATARGGAASSTVTTAVPARFDESSLFRQGAHAALESVTETTALLLWPGRMTWVDPETVTSLIEAHGRSPDAILRPERAGQVGWPVLLPAALAQSLLDDDGQPALEARLAGYAVGRVELGDPGSVLGSEISLDALPDYAGPPEPVGGPPPEWGAVAAETPDPEVSPGLR